MHLSVWEASLHHIPFLFNLFACSWSRSLPLCPPALRPYQRTATTHVCCPLTCLSPPTLSCVPSPFPTSLFSSLVPPLFIALFLSLWAVESTGTQRTGHAPGTPPSTTDMSDSETPVATAEVPVPAACTSIKADLDKW